VCSDKRRSRRGKGQKSESVLVTRWTYFLPLEEAAPVSDAPSARKNSYSIDYAGGGSWPKGGTFVGGIG